MKKKAIVFSLILFAITLGLAIFLYVKNSHTNNTVRDEGAVQFSEKQNVEKPQEKSLVKLNYKFNPHVMSREYVTVYGSDTEELFYNFCDAVLNVESTFKCPSTEKFKQVLEISRTCLPIASCYIDRDKIFVQNGVGHIPYNVEKEDLKNKIKQFKEKVASVISSAVPYKEDNCIMAMELLKAVANKNKFDEAGLSLENALNLHPYRAIMEDVGICQELSGEYTYYLLQIGINATTCSGLSKDKSSAHAWTIIELDGDHYHVDPTTTIDYKNSLAFFCLDDERREQYGNFDRKNFSFADSPKVHYEINSKRFKDLWDAETYTIDRDNRKIHMKIFYSGKEKDFSY